jgi:phosphoribosyl 1,2-cyclic phosphodiesterase
LFKVFARVDYSPEHELEAQIKKTGHDIKDIKAVIMGHLHLDHAGGLEHFVGTSVPIYVHEAELKHAFYSVATKTDFGVYLPHYLSFDLNWQAFTGDFLELAPGINLHHAPGHTPGLVIMQVNLPNSGTWICTTDMYHVHENWEDSVSEPKLETTDKKTGGMRNLSVELCNEDVLIYTSSSRCHKDGLLETTTIGSDHIR